MDRRVRNNTDIVERKGPSGVNQERAREAKEARGPVSDD